MNDITKLFLECCQFSAPFLKLKNTRPFPWFRETENTRPLEEGNKQHEQEESERSAKEREERMTTSEITS